MMKILLAVLLFGIVLIAPQSVRAQFDPTQQACEGSAASASICRANGANDPIAGEEGIIMRVVRIMSYITGAASVIVIIFGGLKYVLANGDSNSITTARNAILYALIGLMVFALSQIIIRFVIGQV